MGLIPKVLHDLVLQVGGGDRWREICARSGVPPDIDFRINDVYDDAQWRRLLTATCDVLGLSHHDAMVAYADFFGQDALVRWPMWFEMSKNSREFLNRQPKIHNGFSSGLLCAADRAAVGDKFRIVSGFDAFVMYYRSANRLCKLYVALARWIVNHYGDEATIEETRCQERGDPECEIRIRWTTLSGGVK